MPKTGKVIGTYRFQKKKTSPDTTTITMVGAAVRRNTIVVIDQASVVDYSAANKKLILGSRDAGGADHYVVVVQETNTFEAHLTGKLILLPTEKPIAVVESPGSGDVLYCTFHGLMYELK